jgi:hypothetical protein
MLDKNPKKKPADGRALPPDSIVIPEESTLFSQQELRGLSFEISARWFAREPSPRLTLSVVHPRRIHAYWHITAAMMKQAMMATKAPQVMVIRFTDLTLGQKKQSIKETTFDIEVDGLDNNWYVDLWEPGKRYAAELGLRDADNALYVFVRSNEIQVPRAEPSPALEFNLAQYKGARPLAESLITEVSESKESTYSVARLTKLLPTFRSFPEGQAGTHDQNLNEPEFPAAPLTRVPSWNQEPALDEEMTATKRASYGTEFPTIQIDPDDISSTSATSDDSPIDFKAVPELPDIDLQIDPQKVSQSYLAFASSLAEELAAEASDSETTENLVDGQELSMASLNKYFPMAHVDFGSDVVTNIEGDIGHLADQAMLSPQTGSTPEQDALPTRSFPQIDIDELEAYQQAGERLESSLTAAHSQAPAGPAPKPVVALEEAIADSFFSASAAEKRSSLAVQLELSGESGTDQILTLFGKPVEVDDQGRFSVRVELEKGPSLAELLRAHRKKTEAP